MLESKGRLWEATQDPTLLGASMTKALVVKKMQPLTTPMTLPGPKTAAGWEHLKLSVSAYHPLTTFLSVDCSGCQDCIVECLQLQQQHA